MKRKNNVDELIKKMAADNHKLRLELKDAREALTQVSVLTDQVLVATAEKYGTEVRDEESGDIIGYRLEIPKTLVMNALKDYEVKTEFNKDTDRYIYGAVKRIHVLQAAEQIPQQED